MLLKNVEVVGGFLTPDGPSVLNLMTASQAEIDAFEADTVRVNRNLKITFWAGGLSVVSLLLFMVLKK